MPHIHISGHNHDLFFSKIQAGQYAIQKCTAVGLSPVFASCTRFMPWTKYHDYCIKDVCNTRGSKVPICNMLAALAHDCAEHGFIIDWMADANTSALCDETSRKFQNSNRFYCSIINDIILVYFA